MRLGYLRAHKTGGACSRGIIVRVLYFSIWLRGENLFCGGVVIKVGFRARGGLLGAGIDEIFVCEFGVLQGAVDRNR